MVNVQENLNDNKDSLEKKSRSLSDTELWKLEWLRNSPDVKENARKTNIDIKAKDWTTQKITAENLIKAIAEWVSLAQWTNYKIKLENADIQINWKKIDNTQFWRGSELMAFLQVAASWNLKPDWKFWPSTALAFSQLLSPVKTEVKVETKIEDIADLSKITEYDYQYPFDVLFPNDAKEYEKYKIFSATTWKQWYFSNCYVNPSTKDVVITYYSIIAKLNKTITFKQDEILAPGTTTKVGVNKFMNALKTKLDANEAKIQKEKWKESVWDGVEDVKVSSFSPFMQEYIKSQWRVSNFGSEIDFKPWLTWNWSGMNIQWDKLYITFPWKWTNWVNLVVPYLLKDIQTNNKFDNVKFVKILTETMSPMAQKWKWEQLATRYNDIQWININSLWAAYTIDDYIKKYENIKKDIDTYSKNWVVVDKKILDAIPTKVEALKNQKDYIRAKNRSEADIKSFEEFYKRSWRNAPSAWEIKAKDKELAKKIDDITKWSIILVTWGTLVLKTAYSKVNKLNEYNAYLERYKKLS